MKRVGALFLALVLTLALFPMTAMAAKSYDGDVFSHANMNVKADGVESSYIYDYDAPRSNGQQQRDYYFPVKLDGSGDVVITVKNLDDTTNPVVWSRIAGSGTVQGNASQDSASGTVTFTISGATHEDKYKLVQDSEEIRILICEVAELTLDVYGVPTELKVDVILASNPNNRKLLYETDARGVKIDGKWNSLSSLEVLNEGDTVEITALGAYEVYYTLNGVPKSSDLKYEGHDVYTLKLNTCGKYVLYIEYESDSYYGGGYGLMATNVLTLVPAGASYPGYGDFVFTSNGFYNLFDADRSFYANDVKLTVGQDYTVENRGGYAHFTVFESVMQSLSGLVRFKATFTDGSSATASVQVASFYVPDEISVAPPKTGDATSMMGLVVVLLALVAVKGVRKFRLDH